MTGTYGPVLNTHAVCCEDYYFPEVKFKLSIVCTTRRTGRTIRKMMGGGEGGEKTQKKIHVRENAKKKNSRKEEGKEKKFVQNRKVQS